MLGPSHAWPQAVSVAAANPSLAASEAWAALPRALRDELAAIMPKDKETRSLNKSA